MPAYYDRKSHNFWLLTDTNGWTPLSRDAFRLQLIERGLSGDRGTSKQQLKELSRADEEINRVIREQQVDFSCDVAGWPSGIHTMYGRRVLVHESPKLWTPAQGDYGFYEAVLKAVARDHPIQYDVIKSWLKLGLSKLYDFKYRYSQALIMVGDTSSGKSLLHFMITVLVGGGVANPLDWMLGASGFNRDIAESEHLCLEEPSVIVRELQKFANKFKELTVVEARRCRGLYSEAVTVCPYQIVSLSTNTEPDNIRIIPEFVRGVEDKLHALYFPSGSLPAPGYANISMDGIASLVRAQAPAWLWHLFNEYQIPETLLKRVNHAPFDCQRFGMDAYHNPILLELVSARSDQTRLLCWFERSAARKGGEIFIGTASKLSEWLLMDIQDPDARKLCRDTAKLGYLLRGLSEKYPQRVRHVEKSKFGVIWMITPEVNESN